MSVVTRYRCEQCGAETDNNYATKGWVSFEGSMTVAAGFHDGLCYRSAYISDGAHHFCSLKCLGAKVASLMPKPQPPNPKNPGGR